MLNDFLKMLTIIFFVFKIYEFSNALVQSKQISSNYVQIDLTNIQPDDNHVMLVLFGVGGLLCFDPMLHTLIQHFLFKKKNLDAHIWY